MFGNHSHKWITDILQDSVKFINRLAAEDTKYTNQQFALVQKQLQRINNKLFTEQENIDFYLSEIFKKEESNVR